MADLLLDTRTHDLVLTAAGDTIVVTDVDLIRQRIKQRLLSIEGEWFLDVERGLPWFTEIIGKGAEQEQISALLATAIADTEGVDSLIQFDLTIDRRARSLFLQFRVTALGTEIAEDITL